jgi:homospermidine synthase
MSPEQWQTRQLCPPWTRNLAGRDRVGVLLCSRRFGELWVGLDTGMESGLRMGTNATQLQVAAGVLAGWSQLGIQKGVHFVEDLDCRQFVATACEVLGPPVIVHDADAAPRALADRRNDAEAVPAAGSGG